MTSPPAADGVEPLRASPIGSPPPLDASTWDLPVPEVRPRRRRAAGLIGLAALSVAIAGWMYGDGVQRAAAVIAPSDAAAADGILPVDAAIDAPNPLGDAGGPPDAAQIAPQPPRRTIDRAAPGFAPTKVRRERRPLIHRASAQSAEDLYDTR